MDFCDCHEFLNMFDVELAVVGFTVTTNLSGGVQLAPGSDVTVLFPGESQVLGSQGRSGEVPGQKSKFSCQYCSLPMNVGDVAIFCERAGADKVTIFNLKITIYTLRSGYHEIESLQCPSKV